MRSGQETEPTTDSWAGAQRLLSRTHIPNEPWGSPLSHCENDKLLSAIS